MFVGIDPERTLDLALVMRQAGASAIDLGTEVEQILELSALTSPAPIRLRTEGTDLDRVGLVLRTRAQLATGADIDLDQVADELNIDRETFRAIVEDLQDPGRDPDRNPLLGTVGRDRNLFTVSATSVRDIVDDLPEPGTDADTDAAIEWFDDEILPRIQNGEIIDTDGFSKSDRRRLRLVTAAMGGNDVTTTRTRTVQVQAGQGDTRNEEITEEIALTDADSATMLSFVQNRVRPQSGVQLAALNPDLGGADGTASGIQSGGDGQFNFDLDGKNRTQTGSVESDLNTILGKDPDTTSISHQYQGDGNYSVTVIDQVGSIYTGTYNVNEDGWSIDLDVADYADRTGSVNLTVDANGHDYSETFPSGGSYESTGFADGTSVSTQTNADGSKVTTVTNLDGSKSYTIEKADKDKNTGTSSQDFKDRGDDADQNGFADFGDPNDTVDPNDPNDTGGNGLI